MSQPAVLITGASTGIGYATAIRLHNAGFEVIPAVRREADAEALRQIDSGKMQAVLLDVCDDTSIAAAAAELEHRLGERGLFGLVNNAGVSPPCPLEFADRQHLDSIFQTNVYGAALLTSSLAPLLRKAQGRIVNISSGAGQMAIPLMGIYSASKFALEAMSDALRVEMRGAGVCVSLVVPGAIQTPIHDKNLQQFEKLLGALPASGRDYYGDAIAGELAVSKKRENGGSPPEHVANAIYRALSDKRPKARYAAGPDARALQWLRPFLSAGLRDRLVGGMTGL